MFIKSLKVWNAPLVPSELQFSELRHGHPESIIDSTQSRFQSSRICAGYLLKKIAAEGVSLSTASQVRVANQLRNDVQISDVGKKVGYLTEILVCIDLFEVGLRKSIDVETVFTSRPIKNYLAVFVNNLFLNGRSALFVLFELKSLHPLISIYTDTHFDHDLGNATGVETPDLRNPSSGSDGRHESTFRVGDVAEESNGIKEIRLS